MGSHCGTQQLYAVQRVAISQLSIMKCIVSQYLSNYWRLGQCRLQLNAASAGGSGQSAVCLQWSAWPRLRILIRCCSSRHIYPLLQHGRALQHCSAAARDGYRVSVHPEHQNTAFIRHMAPNFASSCRDPTPSNVKIDLSIHIQFYNDHCKCIFRNQGSFHMPSLSPLPYNTSL